MHSSFRHFIKSCARRFGAELISLETLRYWERQALAGVLGQIAKSRIEISTVIDVGAAHGNWSEMCSGILPSPRYVLLEPLRDYAHHLERSRQRIAQAEVVFVAAGEAPGERTIFVHPDLVGSSFYLENEDSDVNGEARTVQVETLDAITQKYALAPPYLLKVDVQGAEMDVLAGAVDTLAASEFVVIECSFFDFYGNDSTVATVMRAMDGHEFVLYDFFGQSYRPTDNALAQADLCFVKRNGPFRTHHHFANPEQRAALTRRLQRMNAELAR